MVDKRIIELPLATGGTAPAGSDFLALDGATTRKASITTIADTGIPAASQAEAEAGVNAFKRMTPLTTKQAILASTASLLGLGTAAFEDATEFANVDVAYSRINPKTYGAAFDNTTDDTAAWNAAFAASASTKIPVIPDAGTSRVTAQLNVPTGASLLFFGNPEDMVLRLDTATATAHVLSGNFVNDISISGITLDAGASGSHTAGSCILFSNSNNIKVTGCRYRNSPGDTVLFFNCVEPECSNGYFEGTTPTGFERIRFLNGCTKPKAWSNHFENSGEFCIGAINACLDVDFQYNSCDQSAKELIGVLWDCIGGIVAHNIAYKCGDNGISIVGKDILVHDNICRENYLNGIGLYGSRCQVFNNTCYSNNSAGVSAYAGIYIQAFYAGLAEDNVVFGNVLFNDPGIASTQGSGINLVGVSYPLWVAGLSVPGAGDVYVRYGQNTYISSSVGTAGASPPVHTSGTVSDGGVLWKFSGTTQSGFLPNNNTIGPNKIKPHPVSFVANGAGERNSFFEESIIQQGRKILTNWVTGVATVWGTEVVNASSTGELYRYRANNNGTTGATPPTHTSGIVSDGTINWFAVGPGSLQPIVRSNLRNIIPGLGLSVVPVDNNNPLEIFAGLQAPESIISAHSGAMYLQYSGAIGGTLYTKSGADNTAIGWLPVSVLLSGTTASRPSPVFVGQMYYDTTLNKPIWRNAANSAWVDATGATV